MTVGYANEYADNDYGEEIEIISVWRLIHCGFVFYFIVNYIKPVKLKFYARFLDYVMNRCELSGKRYRKF